ncbi:MAG: riboflavin biosynthesis protein RibF [Pelagibacteraceae bacterium]|nr:riboflavin biosynthesis protein RibF [Pelagibacteraceae bacterium]|tara:strand:+ start:442 stop:1368 length:927 start_codon:yes stop_codon:yes gene_type:complete
MKVLNGYSKIKKDTVLTIGNFDGVHKGHKKIIKQTVQLSKKNNLKSVVVTFNPHPIEFFKKNHEPFKLTNNITKIDEIKKLGVDYIVFLKFNRKLNKLPPEDFIKKLIKFKPKFIVVGYNFHFGYKRKGNTSLLRKFALKYCYSLKVVKPIVNKNKKVFNSTFIRKKLKYGEYNVAKEMLGRNWLIEGTIIKGSGRGQKIGYRTANFLLKDYIVPMKGVYLTQSYFEKNKKKKYFGLANIGTRPTFKGKKIFFENHFFNSKKFLYGKKIFVELLEFLRKEKKFANIIKLKEQIEKDILLAKKIIKGNK